MKKQGKRKKGDLIIILIVLLVGIGAFTPWLMNKLNANEPGNQEELIAVIKRGGKEMERINLYDITEPTHFHYENGIELTIVADHGSIKFLESQCPDQICVNTGLLTKPGDMAVCLPGETIVMIEGSQY
ncbi:MAG: NusG domain II-containing protein [Desulfitobacterium sp.]|nr:NusG domain II-containing protein [Desulfitobacterium sp.]